MPTLDSADGPFETYSRLTFACNNLQTFNFMDHTQHCMFLFLTIALIIHKLNNKASMFKHHTNADRQMPSAYGDIHFALFE